MMKRISATHNGRGNSTQVKFIYMAVTLLVYVISAHNRGVEVRYFAKASFVSCAEHMRK